MQDRGEMGTVMPDFPVSPKKAKELFEWMERLGIKEEDIKEQFARSSGHGGQHVNKRATKVILTHEKTGISVICEGGRSQALNRFLARRRLCEKVEAMLYPELAREKIEKIRRQKDRRRRRAKSSNDPVVGDRNEGGSEPSVS